MNRTSWLCWLIVLSTICLSEAQYKFRRPQLPPPPPPLPPPQIFKKSWAPGPRIPPMGNSIHMPPNFPHKRPLFKPPNYRFRRPPGPPPPPPPPGPMFNVLPNSFKSPISPVLGAMSNYGPLSGGQRIPPPVKELPSIATVPQQQQQQLHHQQQHHHHQQQQQQQQQQQYGTPDYRPEVVIPSLPSTHRGGIDDDKGPIHTIPAPNLGPASKSYQQQHGLFTPQENKPDDTPRRPYSVTQVDYVSVFNGQESNVTPQRVAPSNPTPTTNVQHQYEVTESNEINSVPPTYYTPDFDSTPHGSSIVPEQQANDVYVSHPSTSGSRSPAQLDQGVAAGTSMQANLHSSMHVATSVSGAGAQQHQQQTSRPAELHVGHPAAAGPPMSAAKLYEVLNGFPHQLTDQYALNQQPQIQQHLLQQQLSQILQQQQPQPDDQTLLYKATSFAQPTLHSFNYDEQANKQKQQNVYVNQNYASGRVTADYSLIPETPEIGQEISAADANEQHENNIEFENPVGQVRPTTYFTKIGDDQSISSQFYTTLPNREAAEKLAALAAAGNVNSQLIGQLRKRQQQQQEQQRHQDEESGESQGQPQSQDEQQQQQPMPANHKEEHRDDGDEESGERYNEHRQKLFYRRQKIREEQSRRDEDKEKVRQQSKEEEKRPLRIYVPEDNQKEKDITADYEYENDQAEASRESEPLSEDSEFGSRIISKDGQ